MSHTRQHRQRNEDCQEKELAVPAQDQPENEDRTAVGGPEQAGQPPFQVEELV